MELTLESQGYLEALYRTYLEDPFSLPEEWRRYFSALSLEDGRREPPLPAEAVDAAFLLKVEALRQAYREFGHLAARIDPLGRRGRGLGRFPWRPTASPLKTWGGPFPPSSGPPP